MVAEDTGMNRHVEDIAGNPRRRHCRYWRGGGDLSCRLIAILQAIASGLLGKASYSGGLNTAFLGLILQWAMSLIIAAIFVFAASRLSVLWRRWLAMGLGYGVGIFIVMTFVVVPLSASYPKSTLKFPQSAQQFLAMLLFGVIVSYCARRFWKVT